MIKTLLILLISSASVFLCTAQGWTQIGNTIHGDSEDDGLGSDVAISNSGNFVVVGAAGDEDGPEGGGVVRVFNLQNGAWTQVGQDIYGQEWGESFGHAVDINDDGTRIAIGAPDYGAVNYGQVRVYDFNGTSWVQLGGSIDGSYNSGRGENVRLSSDGNIVAMTAVVGTVSGSRVGVYQFNDSDWTQIGDDITLTSSSGFHSKAIDLSNSGTIIAIGTSHSPLTSGIGGNASVYEFTGSEWELKGDVFNGELKDYLGVSVSLSEDGKYLALGSPGYTELNPNGNFVEVFEYENNNWVQIGQTILGDMQFDSFGWSVSLDDSGTKLAVGGRTASCENGIGLRCGIAKAFELINGVWIQIGASQYGEEAEDQFAKSLEISGDGTKVIVGSAGSDQNGSGSGSVKVFDLTVNTQVVFEGNNSHFLVFPNPTSDNVYINFSNLNAEVKVSVYNSTGSLISTDQLNSVQLYRQQIPEAKGLYFLEVQSADGNIHRRKVVKN